MTRSLALNYAFVTLGLSIYFTWLFFQLQGVPSSAIDPRALLPALFALVLLTALVWLAMLLARNVSVAIGKVSMRYYQTYRDDAPPEWIERPARTFMNLLEVPILFYVACLIALELGTCDRAQILLAWTFVAARAAHAVFYIGVNHVPTRFALWFAGCVTLAVMWVRLASRVS